METTRPMTKSAVALARKAHRIASEAMPLDSSKFAKRGFTQPQLLVLLVLKQFFKTDYRGIVQIVAEWRELRQALELTMIPHYSTLCHAQRRL